MVEKVSILGQEYKLIEQTEQENPKLKGNSGLCEWWSKELVFDFSDLDEPDTMDNIEEYKKNVIRHEIVHAFFHEAGLEKSYGRDETLVDWLALQIPKLVKSMQEAKCL